MDTLNDFAVARQYRLVLSWGAHAQASVRLSARSEGVRLPAVGLVRRLFEARLQGAAAVKSSSAQLH